MLDRPGRLSVTDDATVNVDESGASWARGTATGHGQTWWWAAYIGTDGWEVAATPTAKQPDEPIVAAIRAALADL